jgi:hypothetical protein
MYGAIGSEKGRARSTEEPGKNKIYIRGCDGLWAPEPSSTYHSPSHYPGRLKVEWEAAGASETAGRDSGERPAQIGHGNAAATEKDPLCKEPLHILSPHVIRGTGGCMWTIKED